MPQLCFFYQFTRTAGSFLAHNFYKSTYALIEGCNPTVFVLARPMPCLFVHANLLALQSKTARWTARVLVNIAMVSVFQALRIAFGKHLLRGKRVSQR